MQMSSTTEAVDIFLMVLAGLGVLLVLPLVPYMLSFVTNKLCTCCCGNNNRIVATTNDNNNDNNNISIDQGVTATQAGLTGLGVQERVQILNHVFRDTLFFNSSSSSSKQQANSSAFTTTGSVTEKDLEMGRQQVDTESEDSQSSSSVGDGGGGGGGQDKDDNNEQDCGCADHERVCCICLTEYEDGCALLAGKYCQHKMHYECSMEWLIKHDHCPYCRTVVVSPTEFRQAAVKVLGDDRVNELSHGKSEGVECTASAAATTEAATATGPTDLESR